MHPQATIDILNKNFEDIFMMAILFTGSYVVSLRQGSADDIVVKRNVYVILDYLEIINPGHHPRMMDDDEIL